MPPPVRLAPPPGLVIAKTVFIAVLDIAGAGPRALLSLQPADAATPRTLTPLLIEGDGVGTSAFPPSETGGAPAAAVSFGDGRLTAIVVAAPLTTPAAAAGVAAGIAHLVPEGADVRVVAALHGLRPSSGAPKDGEVVVADAAARVHDPAVAALLHALAACGHTPPLIAVRGHRPVEAGEGAGAAGALGEAAAATAPGVVRFAAERCEALAPDLAAVREVGGEGVGPGGVAREPEAGGLLYC